jgi:hypothetical protein
MARRGLLSLLSCLVLACSMPAHAEEWEKRMAASFDKPVSVRTVPAKSDAEEGNELRCTYYRDFMLRETGTDTPAPGPGAIVSVGAKRPACTKTPAARDIALKTENYSFVGRKGPFLFFEATDPNGAVPFVLIEAGAGKVIYSDTMTEDGMKTVSLDNGALHLTFRRGINGGCSLVKEGAACWSKIAAAAAIPSSVAAPPAKACTVAYGRDKAPPDDPSIVSFDVDIVVGLDGTAETKSLGAAGCAAMP